MESMISIPPEAFQLSQPNRRAVSLWESRRFLLALREWGPYKLQVVERLRGSGQPAQYDLPKH